MKLAVDASFVRTRTVRVTRSLIEPFVDPNTTRIPGFQFVNSSGTATLHFGPGHYNPTSRSPAFIWTGTLTLEMNAGAFGQDLFLELP